MTTGYRVEIAKGGQAGCNGECIPDDMADCRQGALQKDQDCQRLVAAWRLGRDDGQRELQVETLGM